jgi:nicotinate-nucleotide pyrophosphorylase (carboxylating)
LFGLLYVTARRINKRFKLDADRQRIMFIPRKVLEQKLLQILSEDLGQGDVTTAAVVPEDKTVEAVILAKDSGVIAGIEETSVLAEALGLEGESYVSDGMEVRKGETVLKLCGDARTILTAERTLLNVLSRMSGIATNTRRMVEMLKKAKKSTRVAATRKSAPGLLYFDKKAVSVGGGDSHRLHLDDMVLIKDNHIVLANGVVKAVERAKVAVSFAKKVEVEVTNTVDAVAAVKAGADIVMLDNFTPMRVKQAVNALKKEGLRERVVLEVSGGVTDGNLLDFASAGVDVLSIGALTHSVKALDVSLEITRVL